MSRNQKITNLSLLVQEILLKIKLSVSLNELEEIRKESKLLFESFADYVNFSELEDHKNKINIEINARRVFIILHERTKSRTIDDLKMCADIPFNRMCNPISQAIEDASTFMSRNLGYDYIEERIIVDSVKNFSFLNIDSDHPSTSSNETFKLSNSLILRTHCTSFQLKAFDVISNNKGIYNDFKFFTIGRVFRRDNDQTHYPVFHQIDGMFVTNSCKNIQKNLINTVNIILKHINPLVGKLRIRSSFFPFTEQSIEFDAFFDKKFVELGGAGQIHRSILLKRGLDRFRGFAFGLGIERTIGIKIGEAYIY